jgi:hypothetical protein
VPPSPVIDDTVKGEFLEESKEEEDDENVFVVDAIIAKSTLRVQGPWGGEHSYLVRWAGYSAKHDTWELGSNLEQNAAQMIDEFDKAGKSKFCASQT